jgi:RHH-type transcriptional regulator, rel operon repressor / antitoxin RelB
MAVISTGGSAKEQFNVRVSPELKERLDNYAAMVGQSKATIAANALSDYLDWRIPQTENLKLAIAAADRGEFATDDEVEATFKKYGA